MTLGTAPCITRSFIPFLPTTNPEDREDVALHRGNYFSADDQWMLHFEEKMEKAGAKTKAKYNQEVVELEQKNRDLKKQLEEYKDEGESKWQEFKTTFSREMDAVGKTMKDLFTNND